MPISCDDDQAITETAFTQPTFCVDHEAFQKILDWMAAAPTEAEAAGMSRLRHAKPLWRRDERR